MGICKQITVLIFYEVGFKLVTLLKLIHPFISASGIFILFVSSTWTFSFRYSLSFFLKGLLVSYVLTLFRLCTHVWLGLINQYIIGFCISTAWSFKFTLLYP